MTERDGPDLPPTGGSEKHSPESMSLWDAEPFATFRAEPRRFALGLPVVFIGGSLTGALLIPTSLSLAVAVQLAIQTVGFVWLYVPALRRRR